MIGRWVHRVLLQHLVSHRRVTPPMWDRSATGDLWKCSCGKKWAR